MKILHLCNKVPFPGRDGSSLAMEALIRLEEKAGHEVHVLALNTDKHFVQDPHCPYPGVQLEALPVHVSPNLKGFMRDILHSSSFFASRFYHEEVSIRIAALSREVDLVVLDSLFMAVYKESLGTTPWILRAHNVEHQIWERTLTSSAFGLRKLFTVWQTQKLKQWELGIFREAQVWAISEEDGHYILENGAKTVWTLPCTYQKNGPWKDSGARGAAIYHLGAMDWLPNIQGMQWYLKEVHPLVMAPVTVISKTWPKNLSLPAGIHHLSRLEDGFSFEEHGIFIAPILSGSGMRIKLLEAMVRGKAIVTTSIGAEGLKSAPGILIADNPEDFSQAIHRLLYDATFREEQGRLAMHHARTTFADEVYVEALKNLS
jgi:polysaccharide biosynthesis protein PslH